MEWKPGCKLPGPEEIRAACELIQATWTPAERHRRTVEVIDPVETPVIAVSDLRA
jgi:hypothetical protein